MASILQPATGSAAVTASQISAILLKLQSEKQRLAASSYAPKRGCEPPGSPDSPEQKKAKLDSPSLLSNSMLTRILNWQPKWISVGFP